MKKVAILASGSGSNAQNIAEYFSDSQKVKVELILSNNSDAYVLERAKQLEIRSGVFNRNTFYHQEVVVDLMHELDIDLVVLAGFLWLIPENLIKAFPNRIINIHPALLPKYGGKGMYGDRVHQAVIESGDQVSGITIHYVNEKYDEGQIIFQGECPVDKADTPDSLARKIHALEYKYFPRVIEDVLDDLNYR
ncbi:MAG: phosphoribosylglycinamide formyltransferase [Bacteroidales bacterium]|nr:phosphoribosylglycinamide formyltransferase [Bacteroidales bacterium]